MTFLYVILLLDEVSTGELLVIIFAVFILFGPNKIPEIVKGLAKGIRDIKNASNEFTQEINKTIEPIKNEIQSSIDNLKDKIETNSNIVNENKNIENNKEEINNNLNG